MSLYQVKPNPVPWVKAWLIDVYWQVPTGSWVMALLWPPLGQISIELSIKSLLNFTVGEIPTVKLKFPLTTQLQ